MAGLAAAWELTRPGTGHDVAVTVHQRDGLLGGKGASVRGPGGRIEEHGLHIWMGYYENAFRLMADVYRALDRPATRPACPIRTIEEAFEPVTHLGVGEQVGPGRWATWLAQFPLDASVPGEGDADPVEGGLRSLRQLLRLAGQVVDSAGPGPARLPAVTLTADPTPPPPAVAPMAGLVGRMAAAELAGLAELIRAAGALGRAGGATAAVQDAVADRLQALRSELSGTLRSSEPGRRMEAVVDLLLTCAVGAVRDGLLTSPVAYRQADDLDFRDWLVGHGASEATAWSPIVEGMYDLVFAYRGGDRAAPAFSAGLGVVLATRLFLAYRGAIFWRMRAGMGDVVFAPLYEALRQRGVRFEFFSELVDLVPDPTGASIERVVLHRRPTPGDGDGPYEPLVELAGLPCFPARPAAGAAAAPQAAPDAGEGSGDNAGDAVERVELAAGRDFEVAVLAVPAGVLPDVAGRLIEAEPAWADLVGHLGIVATQALQVWFAEDEAGLGFARPGAIVSGHPPPFDTFASMSHLLPMERDPAKPTDPAAPRALGYLCGVLPDGAGDAEAEANARRTLAGGLADLLPGVADAAGRTRWDRLHDPDGRDGDERADAQYWRANAAPWEGYVQSLPGSGRYRLAADGSGFDNLVLAGDWIDCGLNAGCIEAAVIAGIQAANAASGRPIGDGVLGGWQPIGNGGEP